MAYIQYIIITLVLSVWTLHNIRKKGKKLCISWFMEWLFFTFLASFRVVNGIIGGADSENYVYAFHNGYKLSKEPLLYLISDIVHVFTNNYHIYFFVLYGILVLAVLYFAAQMFEKDSNILVLFYFFNIYVTSFGVMRQWIAISLGMVGFVCMTKRKYWKSIFFIILSIGFHFTMVVYLALVLTYVLVKYIMVRVDRKFGIFVAMAVNLITMLIAGIFIAMFKNTEYAYYVSDSVLSNVSWLGYMPTIGFLIIVMIFYKYIPCKDEKTELSLYFIFANLSLVYVAVGLGVYRLMWAFFPIRAWMLYKIQPAIKNKVILGTRNNNNFSIVLDMIILLSIFICMYRTISNGALPYAFTFSSQFDVIPNYWSK